MMTDNKEISPRTCMRTIRGLIEGQYNSDNSAAFHVHGYRVSDSELSTEVYCEGNFNILCALVMDELAELIAKNSKDAKQARNVIDNIEYLLTRYCNEKWLSKTGDLLIDKTTEQRKE